MAKVTVRDIGTTLHHLKRFDNYASRHMDNLPIEQANENVAAARELLANNLSAFEDTDVTTLTADTTDIRAEIQRCKDTRKYYKTRIAEIEQDIVEIVEDARRDDYTADTDWEESRIEDYKESRKELKERIQDLKIGL